MAAWFWKHSNWWRGMTIMVVLVTVTMPSGYPVQGNPGQGNTVHAEGESPETPQPAEGTQAAPPVMETLQNTQPLAADDDFLQDGDMSADVPAPPLPEVPETENDSEQPYPIEEENPVLTAMLPEETGLVLLDEQGESVPLVTQTAAAILTGGDPWYCPAEVAWSPSGTGCTRFNDETEPPALNHLQSALAYAATQKGSGTIYVEKDASFNSTSADFSGMNADIILNILGGFDLVQGKVTGTSKVATLALKNFNSNGTLSISNLVIDDNSDEDALKIENIDHVALTNITIRDRKNGHGLAISNSKGSVTLRQVDITESEIGDGLRITNSDHTDVQDLTIRESGDGNGIYTTIDTNLKIEGAQVTENNAGYTLYLNSTSQALIRDSIFTGNQDKDSVMLFDNDSYLYIDHVTVNDVKPEYSSSLGLLNAAVVFHYVSGAVQFNQNTLSITKPTSGTTAFVHGISVIGSSEAGPLELSAVGNVLDGGYTGMASNAIVVDASTQNAAIHFNWNQICHWSQGYFNNLSLALGVDAAYNEYCGDVPTSSGSTTTIRGKVTYEPIAENKDVDADGVSNLEDSCPMTANPGAGQHADVDGDGIPDACDPQDNGDTDGDGVQNYMDTCPAVYNPGDAQTLDTDKDGIPDACDTTDNGDSDGDGVQNYTDTCPLVANGGNAQWADQDRDDIPDACDSTPTGDTDGDHVDGSVDNCPNLWNPWQTDSDGDGRGDACDPVAAAPEQHTNTTDEMIIPVTGEEAYQTCLQASILEIKQVAQIKLESLPCGYRPAARTVGLHELPAPIPDGMTYRGALEFSLGDQSGENVSVPADTAAVLSFFISDPSLEWQVYFWNIQLNKGEGGWEPVKGVMNGDLFSISAHQSGFYVLVTASS